MVEKKEPNDTEKSTIQTMGNLKVEDLDEFEAKEILQRLIARGGSINKVVQEEIKDLICTIDIEIIASEVYDDLDGICVEELWDRSGPSRYGYTDPSDEVWVMIEEVLTPHVERIRQYQDAGMLNQARQYCLAVLEGISTYSVSSSSEFRNWAPDSPAEAFSWIYSKWKNGANKDRYTKEFEQTVRKKFPEWNIFGLSISST